jgi:hypothetical protein
MDTAPPQTPRAADQGLLLTQIVGGRVAAIIVGIRFEGSP